MGGGDEDGGRSGGRAGDLLSWGLHSQEMLNREALRALPLAGATLGAFGEARGGGRRRTCHHTNQLGVTAASRQRASAGSQGETMGARDHAPTPSHGAETGAMPPLGWVGNEFPQYHSHADTPSTAAPRRRAQRAFHAAGSCLPTSLLFLPCSAGSTQLARPEHSPFLRLGFGAGISPPAFWSFSKPSNVAGDAPRLRFLLLFLIASNESPLPSRLLQACSTLT